MPVTMLHAQITEVGLGSGDYGWHITALAKTKSKIRENCVVYQALFKQNKRQDTLLQEYPGRYGQFRWLKVHLFWLYSVMLNVSNLNFNGIIWKYQHTIIELPPYFCAMSIPLSLRWICNNAAVDFVHQIVKVIGYLIYSPHKNV